MRKKIGILSLFIVIVVAFSLQAQEIKPKGYFLRDSVKIGEPVIFSLVVKYPKNMQLLFPDSSFNYYPFEYISRNWVNTISDDSFSYDSTAYILSTFELDKVQQLALPVFLVNQGDSLPIVSSPDSVYLIELIPAMSDTLDVQVYTTFRDVPIGFNYPYIVIGVIGVLIVFLGTYFIFGKVILEKIRLYKLKRSHSRFKEKYIKYLTELQHNKSKSPEELLILWKKYMEDLENQPYTKQTSKEIVNMSEDEKLKYSLRSIDRSIYGNLWDEDLVRSFELLSEYSEDRYKLKIRQVTHG